MPHEPMTDETALREALAWALPLAERAIDNHRLERLRCWHSDIHGTYKNGVTWAGIYQSEVDQIERARAALVLQSPSQPVVAEPVAYRYVHYDYAGRKVSRYGVHPERVNGHDPIEAHPLYAQPQASPPPVQSEVTQADREAAAKVAVSAEWKDACRAGKLDMTLPVQTMRAHRIAHSQPARLQEQAA